MEIAIPISNKILVGKSQTKFFSRKWFSAES